MHFTDRILVLRRIAHNDNTYIIDTLGRQSGHQSMVVKAGRSAEGRRKRALTAPPACLQIEAVHTGKSLPLIKSVRPAVLYQSIGLNIPKTAQAVFMAGTLRQVIQGQLQPEDFEKFCLYFQDLDINDYRPDFHLHFIKDLSVFLGFGPQNGTKGTFFDVNEGKFTGMQTQSTLDAEQSNLFKAFLHGKPLKNGHQRMEVLQIWETYFQLHTGQYHLPQSIRIYKEMLSE